MPHTGRLLVSQLAAYGLAAVLDTYGEDAFVGHDPSSLEMQPHVLTPLDAARTGELVSSSAAECEHMLEADLEPGQTGNSRRPVMWARATSSDRAALALHAREALLDNEEGSKGLLAVALAAGLGAPAVWLGKHPERGATRLDGVMGNNTSDFVRGVLRRCRPAAAGSEASYFERAWAGRLAPPDAEDKTGWSPPGTRIDPVHQWLAAVGLTLLPVGLSGSGPGTTPCFWHQRGARGVTLPILGPTAAVPRLRALLQRPELSVPPASLSPAHRAKLRSLGVSEVISFVVTDRSSSQSVAFSFGRGERTQL